MPFRSGFFAAVLALAWTMGPPLHAQDFEFIPLALGIERERVQSSMYLGLHLIPAEIDFTVQDPSGVSFPEPWLRDCHAFLQAMTEGNTAPEGLTDGFLRPEVVPAELLEFLAPAYEGAEVASFNGVARLGDVFVLSYTMTKPGFEEANIAFLTLQKDDRGVHLNFQLSANHFVALVGHSLGAFHRHDATVGRESLDDSWHTVAIPSIASTGRHDEDGETIAVLRFRGFQPAWGGLLFEDGEPVAAEAPSDSMRDQAVAFYHTVQRLYMSIPAEEGFLESPEMEQYLSVLDEGSRARVEQGFSTFTPEEMARTLEWHARQRKNLLYVLDAHPVYLMFSTGLPSLQSLGWHEYVIVTESGEFKLANVNRVGPFDQITMQNPMQADLLAIMNAGAPE